MSTTTLAAPPALDADAESDTTPACTGCGFDDDPNELEPWLNGDPYCADCRRTYASLDDAAEWRAYAYH